MKKIAIFLPNDNLGGAEQYLKNIAEYYLTKGYIVDIFFLKKQDSGAWENNNLNLHYTRYNRESKGILGLLFNLFKYRKEKYEYIYTSHIHLNAFVNILRILNLVKTNNHVARESTSIFTRYTGNKLLVYKFLYIFCYSKIDLLICQSNFMKRQLINNIYKFKSKKNIVVIPNLFNYSLIKNRDSNKNIFKVDYPYIVSAGRLIDEKGFDILIDAFYKLSLENKNLKLIILGEGHLRSELEMKIESLELKDKVILMGFVDDVYPYFKSAEVCVVSSRIEGFPNVLLQMMSQNNKVVSTLCAGGIEDLKGVQTCSTNSVEELYNSISLCFTNDFDTRELFDNELKSRSIDNFVKSINKYLNAN